MSPMVVQYSIPIIKKQEYSRHDRNSIAVPMSLVLTSRDKNWTSGDQFCASKMRTEQETSSWQSGFSIIILNDHFKK